jgi:hypothetical protein
MNDDNAAIELSDNARRALERARATWFNYAVRIVRSPNGRVVAILGEAHLKFEKASAIGKEVIGAFELRGVETSQRRQMFGGRLLGVAITAPRTLIRLLSFGAVKGSTIADAKQLPFGQTVEIERAKKMPFGLHVASAYMASFFLVLFVAMFLRLLWPIVPLIAGVIEFLAIAFEVHMALLIPAILLRRYSWCWVVHPFLGILTLRDELMAAGTLRMMEDHPANKAAVVVMGRAHLSGYERLLVERYGFKREQLAPGSSEPRAN